MFVNVKKTHTNIYICALFCINADIAGSFYLVVLIVFLTAQIYTIARASVGQLTHSVCIYERNKLFSYNTGMRILNIHITIQVEALAYTDL